MSLIYSMLSELRSFSATPAVGVFEGGVYEAGETVWAFDGAEDRRVASLEGGADAA